MAVKKPLANYDGRPAELKSGDNFNFGSGLTVSGGGLSVTTSVAISTSSTFDITLTGNSDSEVQLTGSATNLYIRGSTGSGNIFMRFQKAGSAPTERIGFFGASPQGRQTVTGSRGGNAALASLLTALANIGLITNSTS
ncbi:MAG TPA: hypothetical protein PLI74_12560 [Candidatus Kapabacteria bacterium]|nr:hypothetical protein [Candidatus Kapabacteria bacterium]